MDTRKLAFSWTRYVQDSDFVSFRPILNSLGISPYGQVDHQIWFLMCLGKS